MGNDVKNVLWLHIRKISQLLPSGSFVSWKRLWMGLLLLELEKNSEKYLVPRFSVQLLLISQCDSPLVSSASLGRRKEVCVQVHQSWPQPEVNPTEQTYLYIFNQRWLFKATKEASDCRVSESLRCGLPGSWSAFIFSSELWLMAFYSYVSSSARHVGFKAIGSAADSRPK